jgi:hypothetical protein
MPNEPEHETLAAAGARREPLMNTVAATETPGPAATNETPPGIGQMPDYRLSPADPITMLIESASRAAGWVGSLRLATPAQTQIASKSCARRRSCAPGSNGAR